MIGFGLVESSEGSEFVQLEVGMWSGRVFGSIGVCWLHLRGNRGLVWSDLRMDQSLFNWILALAGFGKKGVLGLPKMSLMGLGSIGVSLTRRPDEACRIASSEGFGFGRIGSGLQISSSLVVPSSNRCVFGESLHYSQEGVLSLECTPLG